MYTTCILPGLSLELNVPPRWVYNVELDMLTWGLPYKCRLGTVLDCKGNPEEARQLLTQSFNHFDKRLGPKNPLTGEAQFALALSGLRRMLQARQSEGGLDIYSKVLAPQQQQDLMQQMQKGLQAMQAGFGADHMLVKKALTDYDDTASALRSF